MQQRLTVDHLVDQLEHPETLESLFREQPDAFSCALDEALAQHPHSLVLRTWKARLEPPVASGEVDRPARQDLWVLAGLVLLFGGLLRLALLPWPGREDEAVARFAPSLVLAALAAWSAWQQRGRSGLRDLRLPALLLAALTLALGIGAGPLDDPLVLALLHLPVLWLGLAGMARAGRLTPDESERMDLLRSAGELFLLACLVALGAMVFSGISMGLLEMLKPGAADSYALNAAPFGAVAVPLAAIWLLDGPLRGRARLAPVLARIFIPLFLATTVAVLGLAAWEGRNPFLDREVLLLLNALLVLVLAMTAVAAADRGANPSMSGDRTAFALLVATLLLDALALAAILFRLGSFGFSPNRVVVLGVNLLVLGHLAWLARAHLGLLRGRGPAGLQRALSGYLPAYLAWAALVACAMPFWPAQP